MEIELTLSTKGQIVIPKDVRDALRLVPGSRLRMSYNGNRIVLDLPAPTRPKISYDEFRRLIPRYEGPPVAVEDMTSRVGDLFRDWKD